MVETNIEINFSYFGVDYPIQCKEEDQLEDICEQYCKKLHKKINELKFIYLGDILNIELKIKDVINKKDKENLKMNVLVYDRHSTYINERIINSKDIICPECGELCLIFKYLSGRK